MMDPIASLPNARYERKFVAESYGLAAALAIVRGHSALFREAYPPRFVNNVYLDTPAFQSYYQHTGGAPTRLKTRIRWYGALDGTADPVALELKIKSGEVGGKIARPLPPIRDPRRAGPELEAALAEADLPPMWIEFLRGRQAVLVNRYRRHYFLSGDGLFRLTVDSQIQFFSPGPPRHAPTPPIPIVIEIKYAPEHAPQAARITNSLPLRLGRCSKYVLGIRTIGFVAAGRPLRPAPAAPAEASAPAAEPAPAGAAR